MDQLIKTIEEAEKRAKSLSGMIISYDRNIKDQILDIESKKLKILSLKEGIEKQSYLLKEIQDNFKEFKDIIEQGNKNQKYNIEMMTQEKSELVNLIIFKKSEIERLEKKIFDLIRTEESAKESYDGSVKIFQIEKEKLLRRNNEIIEKIKETEGSLIEIKKKAKELTSSNIELVEKNNILKSKNESLASDWNDFLNEKQDLEEERNTFISYKENELIRIENKDRVLKDLEVKLNERDRALKDLENQADGLMRNNKDKKISLIGRENVVKLRELKVMKLIKDRNLENEIEKYSN